MRTLEGFCFFKFRAYFCSDQEADVLMLCYLQMNSWVSAVQQSYNSIAASCNGISAAEGLFKGGTTVSPSSCNWSVLICGIGSSPERILDVSALSILLPLLGVFCPFRALPPSFGWTYPARVGILASSGTSKKTLAVL